MGLRQRSGFDGFSQQHDTSREDLNLTKYDERYIMPTDSRAFTAQNENANGAYGQSAPVDPQSSAVPPSPAPVYRDRNYVFGGEQTPTAFSAKSDERNYVFGSAPVQPNVQVNAEANVGNGAYMQNGGAMPVNNGERPMVFVLRDDRNMYVYEYSDRLEYYRRTEYGMSYCATKFKNISR